MIFFENYRVKQKKYQDFELVFEYETDEHYAVDAVKTDKGLSVAQSFEFCGIDTSYYSNTDIERKEVWIELAYLFDDPKSKEWHYETHRKVH